MATVSNTCIGTYGSSCKVYLEYILNSQNVQNNTSNITLKLYAQATSTSVAAFNFNGNCKAYIKIDNITKKSSTTLNMDFRNKKKVDMLTWTGNVTHGTDGKLSITISGNFDTNGPSSVKTGSVSKKWTLTTIPRASTITCTGGNIGSNATVNINRASSSFTHTLSYEFEGLTGTIATKTSSTNVNWAIPTTFYTKMPNAVTKEGKIKCYTYLGDNLIGTVTECTFKAVVTNSEPEVSATIVDANKKTIALTGNENRLIKYYSNAQVDITAKAKNGATISSCGVNCNGKIGNGTGSILTGVDSGNFTIYCKDSRQLSKTIAIKKELIEYIKLAFTELTLNRPKTTSNTINVRLKGNYYGGSFGKEKNDLILKYRYKKSGEAWKNVDGEYHELIPNISEKTFSYEGSLGDIYDFKSEYVFEFIIADKLADVPVKKEKIVTRRNTNY